MPTALKQIIWGFGHGCRIPVFETSIGKIGAAICWENKMSVLRTAMYAKGLGDIARAKFGFYVVGYYAQPKVLSLIMRDHPANPVTSTSASAKIEVSDKS